MVPRPLLQPIGVVGSSGSRVSNSQMKQMTCSLLWAAGTEADHDLLTGPTPGLGPTADPHLGLPETPSVLRWMTLNKNVFCLAYRSTPKCNMAFARNRPMTLQRTEDYQMFTFSSSLPQTVWTACRSTVRGGGWSRVTSLSPWTP